MVYSINVYMRRSVSMNSRTTRVYIYTLMIRMPAFGKCYNYAWGPFHLYRLSLIPARIINEIHYNVCAWINDFIQDITGHVIISACWELSQSMLVKGAPSVLQRYISRPSTIVNHIHGWVQMRTWTISLVLSELNIKPRECASFWKCLLLQRRMLSVVT